MINETFANTPGAIDQEMRRKKQLAANELVQTVLTQDPKLTFGSLDFRQDVVRRISGKVGNDYNRLYTLAALYRTETGDGELTNMLERYKKSKVDLHKLCSVFEDEVKLLAATARGRIESLTTDSMVAIASEFLRDETELVVTEECPPFQFSVSNLPTPDRLLTSAVIGELHHLGIAIPNEPGMQPKRFFDLLLHALRSRRATLENIATERRQKAAKQQAEAKKQADAKRESAAAERDEPVYEYPERKQKHALHEGDNAKNLRIG